MNTAPERGRLFFYAFFQNYFQKPIDKYTHCVYNIDIKQREVKTMKGTIKKIEKFWVIIIEREDGTVNDYRFNTKAEAMRFAKAAGIKF